MTIAEGIVGRGHYVRAFLAWQQNNAGWWGEGEVKMFIDDDGAHPTICGTGTEDYFGGASSFAQGDYSAPAPPRAFPDRSATMSAWRPAEQVPSPVCISLKIGVE